MPRTKQFNEAEVLDRAVDLFWEKGFNGTSMQDLVDRLGINRASLYATFGDKDQLFRSALNRYREGNWERMEALFGSDLSPKEKIETMFRNAINGALADSEARGCFVVNCCVEQAVRDRMQDELQQNLQSFVDTVSGFLAAGQKNGEICDSQSPTELAQFIYANYVGIMVMGKVSPDRAMMESVAESCMKRLCI